MDITSSLLQPSHPSNYCLRPVALRLYFSVNLPIFPLPKLTQQVKVVNAIQVKYTYFILFYPSLTNG